MAATLSADPTKADVGEAVVFSGSGFTPGATVTLEVTEEGYQSDLVADAAGYIGSTDPADHATTTLTSTNTNPADGDTVVIDAVTYRFKGTTAQANDVKIGVDANTTLANLKKAINGTGVGDGTDYHTGTAKHTTIFAGTLDTSAHTLKLHHLVGGTSGNAKATTKTGTQLSFPGATFNSGTPGSASTGQRLIAWHPTRPGTFHVTASDGTNSARCSVSVWE